jgi:hypothetical protein
VVDECKYQTHVRTKSWTGEMKVHDRKREAEGGGIVEVLTMYRYNSKKSTTSPTSPSQNQCLSSRESLSCGSAFRGMSGLL